MVFTTRPIPSPPSFPRKSSRRARRFCWRRSPTSSALFSGPPSPRPLRPGLWTPRSPQCRCYAARMLAAIAWNLLTWWSGLPSSSSHALIGGLCGAVFAASGNHWSSIIWSVPGEDYWWNGKGILWKVVVPMISSPLIGLVVGFIVMSAALFPAAQLAARFRQPRLRQAATVQRGLHGFRARHE
jgi:hypothetical protein